MGSRYEYDFSDEISRKADSYGNEKLVRKWTKSVLFMFFNLMGTRMVQIRIAESV